MDVKVAKWILEFLLRKPIDEKIINGVLLCLPLSNSDNRLKKTILLRKIESEISNGSVSEKLLELFEILEELSHIESKTASDLLKKAYCAVAVDCTVRFLDESVEENGKYCEAVERVWRNRVSKVVGLASDELNEWLDDIEAALWDSGVCKRILMRNTRNEALKAVRGYLKEAWKIMGPAFLELVASKAGDDVEELCRGGDGGVVGGSTYSCRELMPTKVGKPNGQRTIRQKHVSVKIRRPRGAKISDVDEEAEASMNIVTDVPTREVDKVQETLQSSSTQLHAVVSDSHLDASRVARPLSVTKVNDVPIHKVDKVQEKSNSLQHAAVGDFHLYASPVHSLSLLKAMDNMSDVNTVDKHIGPSAVLETAEVRRVQEALKFSSGELHAAVTDPLPEALETAKTCTTGNGGKHSTCHTTVLENGNMSNDAVLANPTHPVIHAPRESTENNTENVENNDKLSGDAQSNGTHDPKEQHKRKRSVMDPNGTSHTFDDPIDIVSRVGPRLPPTPKRNRVSPLTRYEDKITQFDERMHLLRGRKKWTPFEEDTLRDAVKKYGRSWKLILECYGDIFKNRTNVDLKDKWRNMIKSIP